MLGLRPRAAGLADGPGRGVPGRERIMERTERLGSGKWLWSTEVGGGGSGRKLWKMSLHWSQGHGALAFGFAPQLRGTERPLLESILMILKNICICKRQNPEKSADCQHQLCLSQVAHGRL